jgi:hypothetical protein
MSAPRAQDDHAAWAERARRVPIERESDRRGIRLKGRTERVGPCLRCGGTDRFGINTAKQVFNCRGCGQGGDVIVLANGDDPGEAAARDCALRWKREGRRVRIARAPQGLDFNDLLMGCESRSGGSVS